MPFTFSRYVDVYADKPNPATGRSFWYTSEIAQLEGVTESLVSEYSRFYSNQVGQALIAGRPKPTKLEVVQAFDDFFVKKAQTSVPVAVRNTALPIKADSVLASVTVEQLEGILRKIRDEKK